MKAGIYISGAGHLLLILWVLLGGVLFYEAEPDVLDATDVTLLSEQEFLALTARGAEPVAVQDIAVPVAPETEANTATASPGDQPPELAPLPEIADPADPDAQPDRPDLSVPVAQVDATAPDAPEAPVAENAVTLLPPSLQPGRPQDAPRVAAAPVPETLPLAQDAPEFRPPDPLPLPDPPEAEAEPEPEPEQEEPPAAPQEATTEIVTEAALQEPEGTPVTGVLPRLRPADEVVQGQATPAPSQPAPTPTPTEDVAEKPAAPEEPQEPVGPPLNFGEVDRLVSALQNCWSIGTLSTAAASSTVVVGVSMNPDGRPVASSIRLLSSNGPDNRAIDTAYEYARRAILRCGRQGFPLPVEKFAHWAEIEITFSPEAGLLFE